MKMTKNNVILLLLAAAVTGLSVWGPEAAVRYKDRAVLDKIQVTDAGAEKEGYRYTLSSVERLFILSRCLNSRVMPESEKSAWTEEEELDAVYENLEGGYAFIRSHNEPEKGQITEKDLYEQCGRQIEELKTRGVVPQDVNAPEEPFYEAELYSAIDVLEPGNQVSVWKLGLMDEQKNTDKSNRLMEAYLDADSGKIYEFYVRTSLEWEEIDADALVLGWSEYMGLPAPEAYQSENPLLETTPYYEKYAFDGIGEGQTIVTVGFYEGIQELFLKISR